MKEIWKDIEEYEGLYMVSDQGHVKSLPRESAFKDGTRYLKGKILRRLYRNCGPSVRLYKDGEYRSLVVQRIVAAAFIKNPKKLPFAINVNGNRDDCSVSNLKWGNYEDINHNQMKNGGPKHTDRTIYHFYNVRTNEHFNGMRYELRMKYNLPSHNRIADLVHCRQQTAYGWMIIK